LKGKRGAPEGNQNARKHGFYSKVLDETERLDFERATDVEGIDGEIALLRVKIKWLLERDPENIKLIMQATNTLARLVRTRFNISKEDRKRLKDAIGNVLRDVALPLVSASELPCESNILPESSEFSKVKMNRLRPYQREVVLAVLDIVYGRLGLRVFCKFLVALVIIDCLLICVLWFAYSVNQSLMCGLIHGCQCSSFVMTVFVGRVPSK